MNHLLKDGLPSAAQCSPAVSVFLFFLFFLSLSSLQHPLYPSIFYPSVSFSLSHHLFPPSVSCFFPLVTEVIISNIVPATHGQIFKMSHYFTEIFLFLHLLPICSTSSSPSSFVSLSLMLPSSLSALVLPPPSTFPSTSSHIGESMSDSSPPGKVMQLSPIARAT